MKKYRQRTGEMAPSAQRSLQPRDLASVRGGLHYGSGAEVPGGPIPADRISYRPMATG